MMQIVYRELSYARANPQLSTLLAQKPPAQILGPTTRTEGAAVLCQLGDPQVHQAKVSQSETVISNTEAPDKFECP